MPSAWPPRPDWIYTIIGAHLSVPESRGALPNEDIQTAEEFLSNGGSNGPVVYAVIPNESLLPGPGRAYDLYSESGDVKFHFYVANNQPAETRATYRTNLVVMVDYQPVQATVTHWDDQRENKLVERVGSGVNLPAESTVDIIDISIPSEHFDEDRMYEVAVSFEANTMTKKPFGFSQRFAVYRNGFDRTSRPCSIPSLNDEPTNQEHQLFGSISTNNAILFFDGIEEYADVDTVHKVNPGETRRFYTSLINYPQSYDRDVFYVPTFDGRPINEGLFVSVPSRPSDTGTRVDARRSFEVTFPEEPGIYELQLASWQFPFEIWRDRDGRINDETAESTDIANSNALRFRVTDESD